MLKPARPAVPAAAEGGLPVIERDSGVHPVSRDLSRLPLTVAAVVAVVFALWWAQELCILLVVSLLASYALSPLVTWMQRRKVPRALGAGLLVIGIVGGLVVFAYTQRDNAMQMVEQLPTAMQKLSRVLRTKSQGNTVIDQVQRAATDLENAATAATASSVPTKDIPQIQVAEPGIKVRDYLWSGSRRAMTLAGEMSLGIFLVYFLLANGDPYKRRLVGLTGQSASQRQIAAQILNDVETNIQHYLLVVFATSLGVAVLTWLAFRWIGIAHAGLWGIASGLLNVIPYLGPVAVSGAVAVAAFLQFGTLEMVLLVSGVSLIITGFEGYLITPWLTGKASRIHVVAVFLNLMFWGWIWGAWGVLLATPMLIVFKIVCEHVERLRPTGEWLSA